MLRMLLLITCFSPFVLCAQSSVEALGNSSDAAQRVFDQRSGASGPSTDKVFKRKEVDVQPIYPGGEDALADQLVHPANCGILPNMEACFGSSKITFDYVVNTDGTVSDVKFAKEGCAVLHPIVQCALRGLQKWTPAKRGGVSVRVWQRSTVRYDLR